jgi:hypothetical protein
MKKNNEMTWNYLSNKSIEIPKNRFVLITHTAYGPPEVCKAAWNPQDGWIAESHCEIESFYVIAWMFLPEPAKGEQK